MPRVLAALSFTLGLAGVLPAADVATDIATSTDVTVGDHRVVLVSVVRSTEFAPAGGGAGPRAVTTLRVTILVENQPGKGYAFVGADLLAAGTAEPAVRPAGKDKGRNRDRLGMTDYRLYLKQADVGPIPKPAADRLPSVKGASGALLHSLTLDDVEVVARKADVRVRLLIGSPGRDERVLFKNVPLE